MSMTSVSIRSNSEHNAVITTLANSLEKAESNMKCLQSEKRKLEQESTKQKLNSSRLEQKISMFDKDMADKEVQLTTYKDQLHHCETEMYEMQMRYQDTLGNLRDKADLAKTLENTTIKLNMRCEELIMQQNKLNSDNSYLSNVISKLQEENDGLNARLTEYSNTMYSRDVVREESRKKISQLTSELQSLRFELEDVQNDNSKLKSKQRDFEEALIKSDGSLNYTRDRAEEDQELANNKISDLNNLVRDLEHERRELELTLTTAEESNAYTEKDLMKRERMRRNLQSKLSHLISMLHATLPGIKVSIPRVKLTLNDEGESTDVEYTDGSYKYNTDISIRSASPHSPLPTDENTVDVESVRQAILYLKKQAAIHDNECKDLKSELANFRDSCNDSKDNISKLSRENKLQADKMLALEKEKSSYRAQLDTARGSLQALEESRKELQNQLDMLQQRHNEDLAQQQCLERDCESLKVRMSELDDDIKESERQRDDTNSEMDGLITKFDVVKKHKDQLDSDKSSLSKQLKESAEEKALLESRLEKIHCTLERSEKEKSGLQLNVNKMQKTSFCTQEKLKSLEETVTDLEKRQITYKNENKDFKNKLTTVSTENSNLRHEKDLLEEQQSKLSTNNDAVSQKLAEQQDKINKIQNTATDNEMARIKIEGQVRSANLALQQKSSELRTLNNKLELVHNDNKHLQNTVSSLTGKMNQTEREKRQLSESLLSLQTNSKLNKQSKVSLEKQILGLQEALKTRDDDLRTFESQLNTSTMTNDKTKRQLKKLESLLGDNEEGTKSRLSRLEEEHRTVLEREHSLIKDKDKRLIEEQAKGDAMRKKINELQDQIATLNVTIHRQEATKKSYHDRMENKTAENKDLRSLLNETYSLHNTEDMTQLPSSTKMSFTPDRGTRSPEYRSRSPSYRRRSVSPARRMGHSPHRSPTRISPYRSRYNPANSSAYRAPEHDLSDVTEKTEGNYKSPSANRNNRSMSRDYTPANQNSRNVSRDLTFANQNSGLEIDLDNAGLKCVRCKSPIGLALSTS